MAEHPVPETDYDLSGHRILVTNDDGVNAEGIALLTRVARSLCDDVWVVAPETEQSGTGHSLTLTSPLRFREVGPRHFAVQGTPTDSVLVAVTKIMPDKRPTLVLSGINRGSNLAEDVTYSGTVAAAIEATLLGIPAIALSQSIFPGNQGIEWGASEDYTARVVRWLMSVGWPADALININFPDIREHNVHGMEITVQGKRGLSDIELEERTDMRGNPYFWIRYRKSRETLVAGTDLAAVRGGAISITPLHLDLTHFETRDALSAAAGGAQNGSH